MNTQFREYWAKIRVTNNAANGGRQCSENKGLSRILNQYTDLKT
jgi:hypothetical protein